MSSISAPPSSPAASTAAAAAAAPPTPTTSPKSAGVCFVSFPRSKKYRDAQTARVMKWTVPVGAPVSKGDMIGICGFAKTPGAGEKRKRNGAAASSSNGEAEKKLFHRVKIKAPFDGKVLEHLVSAKADVDIGVKLLRFDYCLHPVRLGNICGVCGRNMPEEKASDRGRGDSAAASAESSAITQTMFGGKAARFDHRGTATACDDEEAAHQIQKLSLVLDLDLTLLHCTIDPNALAFAASKGVDDIHEIYGRG